MLLAIKIKGIFTLYQNKLKVCLDPITHDDIFNYELLNDYLGGDAILGYKHSKGRNISGNRTITLHPNSCSNPPHISFGHQAVTTVGKLVFNTDISGQGNCTYSEIQSTS